MADIDIQQKRGPGIWPFVIGALALVLVIWALVEFTGPRTDDTLAPPATEIQPTEPGVPPAGPGVAPDPYAPGTAPQDPAAPGTTPGTTDPATPGTMPGAAPGTTPEGTTPRGY